MNDYRRDVRYGSKAGITALNGDVRFTPNSGHGSDRVECLLSAISALSNRSGSRLYPITSSARAGLNLIWTWPVSVSFWHKIASRHWKRPYRKAARPRKRRFFVLCSGRAHCDRQILILRTVRALARCKSDTTRLAGCRTVTESCAL